MAAFDRPRRWSLAILLIAFAIAAPERGQAYSFSGLDPGDEIFSLALSPTATLPVVSFSESGDQLDFIANVTTINLVGGDVINIAPGDVVFTSSITIVSGSETFIPGSFSSTVGADFVNGVVSDLAITDVGTGGAGVLLEANYDTVLAFSASNIVSGVVNGTLTGDFTVVDGAGDALFEDAFGPTGLMDIFISSFSSGGSSVGEVCDILTGPNDPLCIDVTGFTDWDASPNVTIVTTDVPEPGTLWLLGLALIAPARRLRLR